VQREEATHHKRSSRRVLVVSILALAWAPNALADDSLLGPPAGVADEVAAVSLPSVPAPVDPVSVVVDAVAGTAESVEPALPAVPNPPAVVPTVAETVAAATASIVSTSEPARSEPPPPPRAVHVDGVERPRSTASRPMSVPKPSARSAVVEHRVARPSVKPSAVPRPTVAAFEGVVQAPLRSATPRTVPERAPVPTVPRSSWTIGTPPGPAEGSWPACAALLLLLFLAGGVGSRLLQLVPAPHPHALLLRLERPG
jgi:hypothetical protein